jgi:hypothetical protein
MFSVLGFTDSYAANILIIMVSYDLSLFPAWFRYEIIDLTEFGASYARNESACSSVSHQLHGL